MPTSPPRPAARYFRGERAKLVHHGVHGVLQFENFSLHVHGDLLGQVARDHGLGHVGDVPVRTWEVRLPAMEFTESVKSFHVPATPSTSA